MQFRIDAAVRTLMKFCDRSKDGAVVVGDPATGKGCEVALSLPDVVVLSAFARMSSPTRDVRTLVAQADRGGNRDGRVTADEFHAALARFDRNGDGTMSDTEFTAALASGRGMVGAR